MRVDQARHHDAAAAIDRVIGAVSIAEIADVDDRVAGNRDRSRWPHGELVVHREDVRVGQQQVAVAGHVAALNAATKPRFHEEEAQ
jgi:hypothetical protein